VELESTKNQELAANKEPEKSIRLKAKTNDRKIKKITH
jgi:hypothetical protein